MNYIEVDNLSKSFAEKTLFENISFKVEKGDKIAIIAKNGTGKSTLINIILGNELPDSGNTYIRNDIHVNYLCQDTNFNPLSSVFDVIFESENKFINCVKNYYSCLSNYESCPNSNELENAIALMDAYQAWNYEITIKEILQVFEIDNFNTIVGTLSGGQQKRLALAKVLIDKCDMLFLDEPTNHLDIKMIEWLEKYLINEKVTLLLITHDRYFIDNVCDTIFELENHKLYKYKRNNSNNIACKRDIDVNKLTGAYSNFLIRKAEREEIEIKSSEKAKNKYKIELEWMRRQPQARQHKSKKRIETFYEIEEKAHKSLSKDNYNFDVQAARLGKKIIEINKLSKSYDDKTIINNFSYTFMKDDKIGIVGKNGIGKSTLFKLITGNIRPDMGTIIAGSTVRIGYFGQDGFLYNDNKKIIDIVKEVTEIVNIDSKEIGASQFLTMFGFPPVVQNNLYGKLSGGERRRFYLILTLLQNPNFLILDEPTNDLDIQTLNLLEDFLQDYGGVVIAASHDRLFLDKISNHTFAFENNGIIKDFPGNYSQYIEWKSKQVQANKSSHKPKLSNVSASLDTKTGKASYKELKEFETLNAEIEIMEKEKQEIIDKLNQSSSNNYSQNDLASVSFRYGEIENQLRALEDRWLELAELIDSK